MKIGRNHWLKKTQSTWRPKKGFESWEKARVIGVILPCVSVVDQEIIDAHLARWKADGKQIRIMRISEMKMSKKKESLREIHTLYANETTWKGIPDSPDFNEFVSQRFDLVLQLCTDSKGVIEFVPYMLNAGLLVGPRVLDSDPYDVQVGIVGKPWNEVFIEIENWLKKIRYVA